MTTRVLIVEDEFLIAANLESLVEEFGYQSVGIADDRPSAIALAAAQPDIALVDVNLSDGPTGVDIGRELAQWGVAVMYITANPRMVGEGVPGAYGVISKPCDAGKMAMLLAYAVARRQGQGAMTPPEGFVAFH